MNIVATDCLTPCPAGREFLKTQAAADMLGVPYHRLYSLVRYGVIARPKGRDTSGHMIWRIREVEAAGEAIAALDARRKRGGAVALLA